MPLAHRSANRARAPLRTPPQPRRNLTEAIFDTFGYGERRLEAVREFLSHAYHRWRRPSLRYVMLLGDGSFDFKDLLGTGVENRAGLLMLLTSYLWTVSDPAYAEVNGEDLLPDVAIGRLPAANVAEVRAMVDKIIAYERGDASLSERVVLVTDNADRADRAGNFEADADADALASGVLSGHEVRKIYSSELGAVATRSQRGRPRTTGTPRALTYPGVAARMSAPCSSPGRGVDLSRNVMSALIQPPVSMGAGAHGVDRTY